MKQRIVFLVGASGAGKTAVAERLEARSPWSGRTNYFDSTGVPSLEEMAREHGSPEGWQKWKTKWWISELAKREHPLQLLEGQTRPSFILEATEDYPSLETVIILLDCRPEVRHHRLVKLREQPELSTSRMDNWAAYLCGQAEALGLAVIDTSDLGLEEVAVAVAAIALG